MVLPMDIRETDKHASLVEEIVEKLGGVRVLQWPDCSDRFE
jgi:hypothetical protein